MTVWLNRERGEPGPSPCDPGLGGKLCFDPVDGTLSSIGSVTPCQHLAPEHTQSDRPMTPAGVQTTYAPASSEDTLESSPASILPDRCFFLGGLKNVRSG
jgi:hypothetical protein